jgi:hypothetical protein
MYKSISLILDIILLLSKMSGGRKSHRVGVGLRNFYCQTLELSDIELNQRNNQRKG